MRTPQLHLLRVMITGLVCTIAFPLVLVGQGTFRNGGTYTNTGTMTVSTYQNHKPGNPGTTNNTGTINASTLMDNNLASAVINNNAAGTINVTGAGSDFTNGAGATNNSTATSKIQIVNTLTLGAGAFTTSVGEVEYASAGAQTIQSAVGTYGKLTIAGGGGTKSLNGNIAVADQVGLGALTTLDVAGNQLTLNGATPFTGTGTFTATTVNSTVIYNAAGAQQVRGASYYNMTLQNGGTKTAQGGVTIVASGTLNNGVTLDMAANTLTASAAGITLTNTGATIQTAGNVDFGTNNFTIAGTFIYQATSGSQNLGAATYSALTLTNAGTKVFPTGSVNVTGTYSVAGGARNYSTGTFAYASTSAQTVLTGESYNNLTITGAADTSVYKSANGNLSVAGALAINANSTLDMGANSFSTLGSGSLNGTGKIRWSGSNSHVISGAGTTEFYGAGGANILAGTYGNLWFNGSGTMTIPASTAVIATAGNSATFGVTISNNLTVANTGSLTVTGMDLTNDGTLTNGGTITLN